MTDPKLNCRGGSSQNQGNHTTNPLVVSMPGPGRKPEVQAVCMHGSRKPAVSFYNRVRQKSKKYGSIPTAHTHTHTLGCGRKSMQVQDKYCRKNEDSKLKNTPGIISW